MAKAQLPVFITPEGYAKLKAEVDYLWREERPRVTAEVEAAAALGDRSENAEYIYGKKRLREIDKRMRILDDKIQNSKVVLGGAGDDGTIRFGARIALRKPDGKEWTVQIVGADEIDPVAGKLSMDSPIGKALMGRKPEESVEVLTPKGKTRFEILSVDYP